MKGIVVALMLGAVACPAFCETPFGEDGRLRAQQEQGGDRYAGDQKKVLLQQ